MLRTLVVVLLLPVLTAAAQNPIPSLEQRGEAIHLIVDGQPYLIRGGEVGNSSASSLQYMEPVWARAKELHLNTLLVPIYWELLEPREGVFDFSLVDGLIQQARARDMRLVLLWFGSWKNSMSSYAPPWVKHETNRFPRARRIDGSPLEMLSPFYEQNWVADARAFQQLMRHLSEVDATDRTVLMVQVENEIGMIPEARDHAEAARQVFDGEVPPDLLAYLDRHRTTLHPMMASRWNGESRGSWTDLFGEGPPTEEIFMAWHFARYVDRVAKPGKAEYPLPLFVNAALIRPGLLPGEYPSAGPLPHLIDVWRAAAPTIDFFSPDIYFPNFVEWLTAYDVPGNAVFIPEAGRAGAATSAADAFYAFGARNAMGYSPFSIEDAPPEDLLGAAYRAIDRLTPLILESQSRGSSRGLRASIAFDGTADLTPQRFTLGEYNMTATFVDPWTPRDSQEPESHGAAVLSLSDDSFLIAGVGVTLTFDRAGPDKVGILRAEEGTWSDGQWSRSRVLNGDQTHQGRHIRLPPDSVTVQRFTLYRYE